MSRMSLIGVRFEGDDSHARQKYDEFRRYVESNPPRVTIQTTAPPGGAGGNATTAPAGGAGGGAAQPGQTLVRTFGGATVATTAPAGLAQVTAAAAGGAVVHNPTAALASVAAPAPGLAAAALSSAAVQLPAGYTRPAERRPAEVIGSDIADAIRQNNMPRREQLAEELRANYGPQTRQLDVQLAREDRRAERQQRQAAGAGAAVTERYGEQLTTRYENRLAGDAVRQQREGVRAAKEDAGVVSTYERNAARALDVNDQLARERATPDRDAIARRQREAEARVRADEQREADAAREQQRQQRDTERGTRINQGTRVVEARAQGGSRGELAEVERQLTQANTTGAGSAEIAQINRRRAQVLARITDEEFDAHRREVAAQERVTAERERQAGRTSREQQQTGRAQLAATLAGLDTPAERAAAVREAQQQLAAPGSREHLRLEAQARRFERQAAAEAGEDEEDERRPGGGGPGGGGGGRGRRVGGLRVGRLNQEVTWGFLAHQAARVGDAAVRYGEQLGLTAGDPMRELQARQQFEQSVEGVPLVGPVAGIISRGLTAATGGLSTDAQIEVMQRQREDRDAALARINRTGETRLELGQQQRSTAALGERDPYRRRQLEINNQQTTANAAVIEEQRRQIRNIENLESEGKNIEADRARSDLREYQSTVPDRFKANTDRMRGEHADLDFQLNRVSRTTRRETTAASDALHGDYLRSRIGEIDAQMETRLDAQGNVTGFGETDFNMPGLTQAQRENLAAQRERRAFEVAQAGTNERRRVRLAEGSITSMRSTLADNPLQAQRDTIKANREAALIDITAPDEVRRINQTFDLEDANARRQRGYDTALASEGLRGGERSLRARLRRDPVGAQAIDLETQGASEAIQFTRAGMAAQAQAAQQNTLLGLDVMRQNYLDQFRGVQVNTAELYRNGPKDAQDPREVLNTIREQREALANDIRQALAEVAAT